jgi:hypothetical protein
MYRFLGVREMSPGYKIPWLKRKEGRKLKEMGRETGKGRAVNKKGRKEVERDIRGRICSGSVCFTTSLRASGTRYNRSLCTRLLNRAVLVELQQGRGLQGTTGPSRNVTSRMPCANEGEKGRGGGGGRHVTKLSPNVQ